MKFIQRFFLVMGSYHKAIFRQMREIRNNDGVFANYSLFHPFLLAQHYSNNFTYTRLSEINLIKDYRLYTEANAPKGNLIDRSFSVLL